jgi:integrase
VLSSMFQTAAEDGLIPFNVVRGVRFQAAPPKRRRALTADEWHRVRTYLRGDDRLLFDIVMGTGARIEEVLGMETGDIHGGAWTISRVRNEINSEFTTRDRTKTLAPPRCRQALCRRPPTAQR